MPRLLELCAGAGSVGKVFEAAGWEMVSLDLDPKARANLTMSVLDIPLDFWPEGTFDFVWASPPCTLYSTARTTGAQPERALEVFHAMHQQGVVLDRITYSAMISTCDKGKVPVGVAF